MRTATSPHLLPVPAALLAAGCNDSFSSPEPSTVENGVPTPQKAPGPWRTWRTGPPVLRSRHKIASFSTPEPSDPFNRSDGAMTITKVAGTTCR